MSRQTRKLQPSRLTRYVHADLLSSSIDFCSSPLPFLIVQIDVSVNAPESGTIVETYANEEDTVTVGQDLLKIEAGDAPAEGSSSGSGSDESKGQDEEESKGKDEDESKGKDEAEEQHEKKDREISGEGKDKGEQQSKLAKPESGAGGDNRPGSDSKSGGKTDSKPKQPEQQPPKQPKPAPSSSSSSGPSKTPAKSGQVDTTGSAKEGSRTERRVKMSRMRLRIAERLKQSQNTAASLTTFNEIDMSALMAFRSRHKDRVLKDHGVKLGFMSAFAKASAQALKEIPAANASIEGDGLGDTIVYRDFVDLSVAVSTDKGLVTPVVRNVETMSLIEIERAIADLGKKVSTCFKSHSSSKLCISPVITATLHRRGTTSSPWRTWPVAPLRSPTEASLVPSSVLPF